jgi:hypothetical protein
MKSKDKISEKIKEALKLVNTSKEVPKIALDLYNNLSGEIHSHYKDGVSKIYLIKQELVEEGLELMKGICEVL